MPTESPAVRAKAAAEERILESIFTPFLALAMQRRMAPKALWAPLSSLSRRSCRHVVDNRLYVAKLSTKSSGKIKLVAAERAACSNLNEREMT
jgi:hypothetical protein